MVDIPARLHFATVNKQIQRGLFTGIAYRLLPEFVSHAWLEVQIDQQWRRIDTYINDLPFYMAARDELRERGWDIGFSIASSGCGTGIDFDLDENRFVQMHAVRGDHGVWEEPADYYRSSDYRNRPGCFRLLASRFAFCLVPCRCGLVNESWVQPTTKRMVFGGEKMRRLCWQDGFRQ